MSGKVFYGGTWVSKTGRRKVIGGAWRRATRSKIYKGGAWHDAETFILPLTVSVSPDNTNGSEANRHPVRVTSGLVTLIPVGGLGPYTYSWNGNGTTPTNPVNATTAFFQNDAPFNTLDVTVTGTVTDSLGSTASATVAVSLTNEGE